MFPQLPPESLFSMRGLRAELPSAARDGVALLLLLAIIALGAKAMGA